VFTVSPVSIIRSLLVWTVAIALASLQDGLTARRRDALEMAPIVPQEA
jgi:hypothetical protein